MNISIPFESTEESVNLIKLSSLYFDKTTLFCPTLVDVQLEENYQLYDKNLLNLFEPLKKNSVVSVKEFNIDIDDSVDSSLIFACQNLFGVQDEETTKIVEELLFHPMPSNEIFNEKVNKFLSNLNYTNIRHFKKIIANSDLRINDIITDEVLYLTIGADDVLQSLEIVKIFYKIVLHNAFQLTLFNNTIIDKNNCITNNNTINDFLNLKYNDTKTFSKNIIFNMLPIFLPNVCEMEFEDILELRFKLYDELQEMRYYIDNLSSEFSVNGLDDDKIRFNLEKRINPSIKQLERKVSGLTMRTLHTFIDNFKNPHNYAPLLTSFFTNIPAYASLLLSLGFITTQTVLKYKEQQDEIKNDPLYFSLKFKKYWKKYEN